MTSCVQSDRAVLTEAILARYTCESAGPLSLHGHEYEIRFVGGNSCSSNTNSTSLPWNKSNDSIDELVALNKK